MNMHLSSECIPAALAEGKGFLVSTHGLLSDLAAVMANGEPPLTPYQIMALPPRERVFELEKCLLRLGNALPGAILPVKHFTAGGVYVREMFIPRGAVATGFIHKTDHVAMIDGDITIFDEAGLKRLSGRVTFTSKAGIKRAAFAHEDTFFITAHRTDETDIQNIEDSLVTNSYDEVQQQ